MIRNGYLSPAEKGPEGKGYSLVKSFGVGVAALGGILMWRGFADNGSSYRSAKAQRELREARNLTLSMMKKQPLTSKR